MMRILIAILLVSFASLSFAGSWDTPTRIAEGVSKKAIFIDGRVNLIHAAWCQKMSGSNDVFLFYKQSQLSDPPKDGQKLEGVHGCSEVVITGNEDGKNLIIVFSGARTSGITSCTEKNPDGCIDIYYKMTNDGGLTWSLSLAVPRSDLIDVVDRLNPQLINVRETQRIWIVYMKNDSAQEYPSLQYVTKPGGSVIFVNEAQLLAGEKRNPSAAYTGGKLQILHATWHKIVDENYIGYYARSIDAGKTWTQPASIIKWDKSHKEIPVMKLQTNNLIPAFIFMTFPNPSYTKWVMRWSNDHGATWSSDVETVSYYKDLGAVLCPIIAPRVIPFLFMVSESGDQGEFGVFNLAKNTYTKEETPFVRTEKKFDPVLACVLRPGPKPAMVLKAMVSGGENGLGLFFTTQAYEVPLSNNLRDALDA